MIQPILDFILIDPKRYEEETESGILISRKEVDPDRGEVIAVGPGRKNRKGRIIEMSIKVGENVIFDRLGVNKIKFEGKDYLIISERDVFGKIG